MTVENEPMDDWYCSERSLSAEEPLEGTAASGVDVWLVLEHDAPFGPKGYEDSGLSPEVVSHLGALAKLHPELRIQLIRRPEARSGPLSLYLASGTEGSERLWRIMLDHHEDLLDVDLEGFLAGQVPAGAERVRNPLYLVCVHGRRDRCCARKGMPTFSAIAKLAPDATYQTTHLGGHRFAATLAVLPAGICYGRVPPEQAPALVAAHDRGELHALEHMRGRMRHASAVQSAEIALRKELGNLLPLDGVRLVSAVPEDSHVRCIFRESATGVEHTIRVRREGLPPIAASCGAEARSGEAWVELRLH